MFYSDTILSRKGPLATVWLACHWDARKLTRPVILSTNLLTLLESLEQLPATSLRLKGQLLLGLVRIYDRKIRYLLDDLLGFKDQIRLSELEMTARRTQTHAQIGDESGSSSHTEHGSTHKRARLDLITFPAVGTTDPSLALALLENKIAMSPNPHQRSQTMAQSPISIPNGMMHQNALTAFEPDMEALGWPSEWDIHYDDLLRPEQPRRDMGQNPLDTRATEDDIEVPRRAPTLDPLDMIIDPPTTPNKSIAAIEEQRSSLLLPMAQDGFQDDNLHMASADMMMEDSFMASLEKTTHDAENENRLRDSLSMNDMTDQDTDINRRTSVRLAAAATAVPATLARNASNFHPQDPTATASGSGPKKSTLALAAKPRSTRLAVDAWIEIPGAMIQSQLKDTSDIIKSPNQELELELELEINSLWQAGGPRGDGVNNNSDNYNDDDDGNYILRTLLAGHKKPLSRKRQVPDVTNDNEIFEAFEPELLDRMSATELLLNGDTMVVPTEASPWEDWATTAAEGSESFSHGPLPVLPSPGLATPLPMNNAHHDAAMIESTNVQPVMTRTPDLMMLLSKEAEARVSFSHLLSSTVKAGAVKDKRIASGLFFQVLTACSRGHLKVEQSMPFGDVTLVKVSPV